MKIKSIAAICKKNKNIAIFERYSDDGDILTQYIGDGSAVYPVVGLPQLDKESLLTIFDVPEKDRDNYFVKTLGVPAGISFEDTDETERHVEREGVSIIYSGRTLKPIRTTRGLVFIESRYLSPVADVLDVLELYERRTTEGTPYIVAKAGFLLQAVINLKAKGGELKIGTDYELSAFIEKKIGEEGYAPAAVVGEIKRLGLTFKTEISEKTIYNYIDKGIFYGISRESLPEHGERKRKYDKVERKKAARAPQGESIEERPQEINDRQTFGHWEGDCVCGKKRTKETLFVLSERLTRNEIIIKMPDQTAASVVAALNKLERRFGKKFSQIFKSITFDNGSEFMDCAGIEKSIYGKDRKRTKVYYCHPYSAYERGTNENINKMIRRFLPKGTDFRKVTAAYIQRVETWINNYPREILGFETSGSLFERYVAEAA